MFNTIMPLIVKGCEGGRCVSIASTVFVAPPLIVWPHSQARLSHRSRFYRAHYPTLYHSLRFAICEHTRLHCVSR